MPAGTRIAYERGINEWLPRILYGADANTRSRGDRGVSRPASLSDLAALPTVDVVRAY